MFSYLPPPPRSSTHPNMLAITTQQRTYFAGASSQEEMQSWIGMLESLRQHHQQQQASPVSLLQSTPADTPTAFSRTPPQNRSPPHGAVEGAVIGRLCVVSVMFECTSTSSEDSHELSHETGDLVS